MMDDPFDGASPGPTGTHDDAFRGVVAAQKRAVVGLVLGGATGAIAAYFAWGYAEPEVGVWAILIALAVLVVIGYPAATIFAAIAAFGGLFR